MPHKYVLANKVILKSANFFKIQVFNSWLACIQSPCTNGHNLFVVFLQQNTEKYFARKEGTKNLKPKPDFLLTVLRYWSISQKSKKKLKP